MRVVACHYEVRKVRPCGVKIPLVLSYFFHLNWHQGTVLTELPSCARWLSPLHTPSHAISFNKHSGTSYCLDDHSRWPVTATAKFAISPSTWHAWHYEVRNVRKLLGMINLARFVMASGMPVVTWHYDTRKVRKCLTYSSKTLLNGTTRGQL